MAAVAGAAGVAGFEAAAVAEGCPAGRPVPRYGTWVFGGGAIPDFWAGDEVVLRAGGAASAPLRSIRATLALTSLPESSALRFGGPLPFAIGGRAPFEAGPWLSFRTSAAWFGL